MRASRPALLLFTCAMVLVGQASAGKSPSISSLSPTSGAVGTSVTVSGSNFGSSQGSSTLTFNGVAATPSSWKTGSIVATVPATATTGPVVVTVGGTHSNGVTFTVTPVISSLSPTSGAVGTTVAISGSGFGATQGSSTVTFNGQLAAPTSWNATTIGTSVPSGATTGPVIVKVNSVSSNAVNFTVPPTLQSIAVSSQASSVPVGFAEPFVATGTYSDQSTKDLTAVASWTSLNTTVATISSPGVAMGQSAGNTMITATYANASASAPLVVTSRSLVTIAITPSNDFIPQGGAQQLTAMGKYSDGSSQDITTTVTWSSSNPSVAMINASGLAAAGSSGSASIVALLNGLGGSSNVTVTAAGPPTITATAFPPANAAGWNNSNVTVTFACTPGSYTITTCPGPQTVSSEGTNQIVSGTGTDSVGNTATASVPLNIDKTPPSLVVASPTDGDVFTNAAMAATGTISDALSGVATLTCNQAPVTFNGGSFSCNVSLNPGLNLVVLRSTDVAGNAVLTKMHVTLNVPLPSPASLQITPANATLVAGETQQFTAADEQGHPRNDATWTISNTTIASITADSSPVLTALGVGQVTLTAAVAGVSAQTQVTILGIGQAPGTPRWSISPLSGSVGRATFQAVPASGSPDIYFVEDQSNGNAVLRAFTSDGRQMWQQSLGPAPLLGSLWMVWPDSFGGLLVWNNNELSDFDSQTGAPVWEVTVAFAMPGLVFPVIRPDGGIVSLRAIDSTSFSLDILDGNTGQRTASFPLPKSLTTSTLVQNDPGSASSQTTTTPGLPFNTGVPLVPGRITVGSDGTTYLEWPIWNNVGNETNTCTASPCGYTTYVTSSDITTTELLMVVSPEGSSISQQSLASDEVTSSASGQLTPTWSQVSYGCSGNYASPGQQIPDGDGGVLASWSEMPCTVTLPNPATPYSPVIVTHFSSNGPSSYQLPLLYGFQLVLGENGTAFATGFAPGYTVTNPTPPSAVSFDMNSGQAMWTYNSTGIPPGGLMGFIAATDDGGVAVADGPNIVQLDPQGSPTIVAPIASLSDSWKGLWDGVSNGSLIQTSLPIVADQASPWPRPLGDPSQNGAAGSSVWLLRTIDGGVKRR